MSSTTPIVPREKQSCNSQDVCPVVSRHQVSVAPGQRRRVDLIKSFSAGSAQAVHVPSLVSQRASGKKRTASAVVFELAVLLRDGALLELKRSLDSP